MKFIAYFKQTTFFLFLQKNVILIFLFTILIFLSTWHLSASPATWFDEGINVGIVKSFIQEGVYSLQIAPHHFVQERPFLITTNYPVLIPVALATYFGGMNFVAVRTPMVLFLWLFAALSYLLVNRLYGKKYALLSLALIITFVPFYGNGKAVLGEVPGLVFLLAALLAWPKRFQPRRLLIAGLLFGLSIASKPFFLIVIPALFLGELYNCYWLRNNFFWQRAILMFGGALLPLILWFYTILPNFSWQSMSQIIGYYSNSYAASGFVFQIITNIKRFFTETTPIHFMVLAAVTGSACFVRTRRRGQKSFEPTEIVLWVFIFINVLWYLKTPGWYRYFFTAHLLLFLFFPAALDILLARWSAVASLLVIFLILIQFGYLVTKRHDTLYNSSSAEHIATQAADFLKAKQTILVINAPSVAFLLPSDYLYQYLQINPALHFGQASLYSADGQPYHFILLPGNPDSVLLPNLAHTLSNSYQLIRQEGHYMLYRYRL